MLAELIDKPEKFHIFKYVLHHSNPNVSKYDLPSGDKYKELFANHPLGNFRTLESLCSLFAGCPLESLESAISTQLPNLLSSIKEDQLETQKTDAAAASKQQEETNTERKK